MTVEELEKKITLYRVSKLLKLSSPAVYKWRKTNKVPKLRLFELKELRPDLFDMAQK